VVDGLGAQVAPGEIEEPRRARTLDVAALPGGVGVEAHRPVPGLVVEVSHRDDRDVLAALLADALVPVGERLAGDGAKAGGLDDAAASRRPVVGERDQTWPTGLVKVAWVMSRVPVRRITKCEKTAFGSTLKSAES
jgi:hypothetical protein